MENKEIFTKDLIISDIHGNFKKLKNLLDHDEFWEKDTRVIFLGDFIDRGNDVLETILFIKKLVEKGKAIAILGDHEKMFLDYLHGGKQETFNYIKSGGTQTIKSLLGNLYKDNDYENQQSILEYYSEIIEFIRTLPNSYSDAYKIYVHAGINPKGLDESSLDDLLWNRDSYIYNTDGTLAHNTNNHVLVSGHTITNNINPNIAQGGIINLLNKDSKSPIIRTQYPKESPKYFIDGGSVKYNNINVLGINQNGTYWTSFTL